MTIKCKRSFVEMTYDKPNYASFGPYYLVDCLNIPALYVIQICEQNENAGKKNIHIQTHHMKSLINN